MLNQFGQTQIDPNLGQLGQALMQSGYAQNSGGMGVIAQLLQTFMGQKLGQKTGDVTKTLTNSTPLTDGMNPGDY
jgi:hypothetical protein